MSVVACCGGSEPAGSAEEKAAHREQEKMIAKDRTIEEQKIKMLLLGAGESGKSTIFKQVKLMHQNGYSEDERKNFIPTIQSNIVQSMKHLIKATEDLGSSWDPANEKHTLVVKEYNMQSSFGSDTVRAVIALWQDKAIQEIYNRRSEFQLTDSTKYYMDRLEDITSFGYIPSEQDVLRARVRTTGIVTSQFYIEKVAFEMYDVGGQRNERRKWIHCFDNVSCVIFVAAASEYDQKLYEDESQNRMVEAITLFEQICNSKWFQNTSIILFLNKKDLLEQKLADGRSLTKCFEENQNVLTNMPGYVKWLGTSPSCDMDVNGGTFTPEDELNARAALQYLKSVFLAKNDQKGKKLINVKATCATDTENVKFVFDSVVQIVLNKNMESSGLA